MKKIFGILSIFIVLFLISMVNVSAYGWGLSKNSEHRTPDVGKYNAEIEGTSSYYVGDTSKKDIYLTFDAGYDNGNYLEILSILKEKDVKATFFITGDFIRRHSDLVLSTEENGHIIGNHSWGHKDITKLSSEEISNEIKKLEEAYTNLTSKTMAKFFRPPAGSFDKQSLMKVQALGYSTFFWSLAYKDWETNRQMGKDYAYNSVMNNIHNGAIILMHTVSNDNVEALPDIIDSLRNEGYTFRNLDYLLETSQ